MIDKNTAIKLVTDFINSRFSEEDDELVIAHEGTIEKDYGWVFFYNSKKFLETGEFSYALAGNGPIIFDKRDGSIHSFGTYKPPEEFIKEYDESRQPS